jgi:hypothetical protein
MKSVIIALLWLIIPAAVSAAGAPPVPVLPVIMLTSTTGTELVLDQLGSERKVLLVLVTKGNPAGERLLGFLEDTDDLPADRVAIVVSGADGANTSAIAKRFPALTAPWYADPEEKVAKGLKLQATPVTMGIRNAAVAWKVLGLHDQEKMAKTLWGWIKQ